MSIKNILFLMTAIVLCCISPITSALSLGALHASSRQGESLQAEVKLISFNPKTRLEQITARIPPLAMFQRFNLRRDAFLDRIRLTSVQTGSGFLIKLASAGVMPSKPVDLLLEIEINGERTLKQYRLALPAQRAALPLKRAKPLPVAVPANVLSKKVPQHVSFVQPNKPAQQKQRPQRGIPQKQVIAKNTRALPVARPVTQARKPKPSVRKPVSRKPVSRKIVSRKPVAKRTVARKIAAKRPAVRKPAVKTVSRPRQQNKATQPARPAAQKPVWAGNNNFQAAQPLQEVYDASAPYIENDWQSTEHYYQDYQLPKTVTNAATANTAQMTRRPAHGDNNYTNFVPPPLPVATHYTVKRGDTLFKIAARQKPSDVSTDQMLFALYKQNPAQLPTIEKIDKLYVGQRLKLPTPDEVRTFSRAQGRKFKQSYLEKHQQRLAKKRKKREAANRARLAAEKARQLAKAQQKPSVPQTRTSTLTNPVAKMTGAKTALLPVAKPPVAKPVMRADKTARSVQQAVVKPVLVSVNNNAAKPENNKVTHLEGRLRKVKRLLEIEKQKHTTTKQVIKEKNRLIQRKDNMIQELQVTKREPAGKTIARTDAAHVRTAQKANATQVKQTATVTTMAASGVAAARAPAAGVAGTTGSAALLAAADNNAAPPSTDPLNGLVTVWAGLLVGIKDFFVSYPVPSVLLPVMALLGLLMLLFKPKRGKRAKHAAAHTENGLFNQPMQAAESAIDYVSPVRSRSQNNSPPHSVSVQADRLNGGAAADSAAPATATSLAAVDPNALSMNGHGPQTVVINISAPARINIDMATEGKELDLLRQQTDKLKESLRSLENSSRLLSDLNASS